MTRTHGAWEDPLAGWDAVVVNGLDVGALRRAQSRRRVARLQANERRQAADAENTPPEPVLPALPPWLEAVLHEHVPPQRTAPKKPRRKQASPLSDRVKQVLALHPEWNAAAIAAEAGASPALVDKVRRQQRAEACRPEWESPAPPWVEERLEPRAAVETAAAVAAPQPQRASKSDTVRAFLAQHPEWSSKHVAAEAQCSAVLVSKVRAKLREDARAPGL